MKERKITIFSVVLAIICMMMVLGLSGCSSNYDKAVKLFEEGKYAEARKLFQQSEDTEESKEYIQKCNEKTVAEDIVGRWTLEQMKNDANPAASLVFNNDGTLYSQILNLHNSGIYTISGNVVSVTYQAGGRAEFFYEYVEDQLQLRFVKEGTEDMIYMKY